MTAPTTRHRRIGFFGAFHPMTARAGGASTGMALLLSELKGLDGIVVFGPRVAEMPPASDPRRLEVVPVWQPDDLLSLFRTLKAMSRASDRLDGYIFSIYVTAFGRSIVVNTLGLTLPVLLRWLTGKPVVVFMHTFVETQDVTKLGYRPSPAALRLARVVELFLITQTTTAVGLESQKRIVEAQVGGTIAFVPMRFTESVNSWMASLAAPPAPSAAPGGPLRVLLFGSWGPQKDMDGAFQMLQRLQAEGLPMTVSVAGSANPNFPEYQAKLDAWRAKLPPERFRFLGQVPEDQLRPVFESHDLIFLPYVASGGYSGVMNLATTYGLPIVAYDHAQLRECATLIQARAEFVPMGDLEATRRAFLMLQKEGRPTKGARAEPSWLPAARRSAEDLLGLLLGQASA